MRDRSLYLNITKGCDKGHKSQLVPLFDLLGGVGAGEDGCPPPRRASLSITFQHLNNLVDLLVRVTIKINSTNSRAGAES